MNKILASNFKMNHTRASAKAYVEVLDDYLTKNSYKDEVYLFLPATALDSFDTQNDIVIGAQNAYPAEHGSFTGETGKEQLDEFGIKTILIGHSERRHIFKESQEFAAQKFKWFKTQGFKIIYCIGEPEQIRENGFDEVKKYLLSQFEGIDTSYEDLIVAYEPVWAIGTGKSATPELIAQTHEFIKTVCDRPLLYGGSAKPENIAEILAVNGCDGALIGTASWDVESFKKMLTITKENFV